MWRSPGWRRPAPPRGRRRRWRPSAAGRGRRLRRGCRPRRSWPGGPGAGPRCAGRRPAPWRSPRRRGCACSWRRRTGRPWSRSSRRRAPGPPPRCGPRRGSSWPRSPGRGRRRARRRGSHRAWRTRRDRRRRAALVAAPGGRPGRGRPLRPLLPRLRRACVEGRVPARTRAAAALRCSRSAARGRGRRGHDGGWRRPPGRPVLRKTMGSIFNTVELASLPDAGRPRPFSWNRGLGQPGPRTPDRPVFQRR